MERRCQAQLVPTNHGRMCTLTNENVIPIRCITTEAVNTNNDLILIFIFLIHGFLKDGCSIGRQTHVRSKGIGMVIYPLHEFRLRARAAKIQIGEQPFQICYGALPIHPQTTTCLPEQAFNFTLHTRRNHATPPFEMLLGLRELLQTAVSKPLWNCLNIFGISSAKGSKGNRADVPHFRMVSLSPQPLAQHRRGSNLHNWQVLGTFFSLLYEYHSVRVCISLSLAL